MQLHHIREKIRKAEREISSRGYKNDIVICTFLEILKQLNKEVERLNRGK